MIQIKPEHVGAVILAAGRSERMKEFKALLPFDAKTRFLEKILLAYANWGCCEIIVVTNIEAFRQIEKMELIPSAVKVVINDKLELERFYSVKLGLGAISKSLFCFIQDVDNPFIDGQILNLLYTHRSNEKYISPAFENKRGHPVLLNRENINQIRNWPVDSANFREVLNTMKYKKVEMQDDRVLININSPEEYAKYFAEWN